MLTELHNADREMKGRAKLLVQAAERPDHKAQPHGRAGQFPGIVEHKASGLQVEDLQPRTHAA